MPKPKELKRMEVNSRRDVSTQAGLTDELDNQGDGESSAFSFSMTFIMSTFAENPSFLLPPIRLKPLSLFCALSLSSIG